MVRYINASQKATIMVMLEAGKPPIAIADATGVSERQAYRYQRNFEIIGDPFPPTRTPHNAAILKPWAVEVSWMLSPTVFGYG